MVWGKAALMNISISNWDLICQRITWVYESIYKPHTLPMCVVLPFFFFVKQKLMCKLMRNKSEILTIWQDVRIVFKQIIVVNLFFTSSYPGVYLKAESSNKNTEFGYREGRSNLTIQCIRQKVLINLSFLYAIAQYMWLKAGFPPKESIMPGTGLYRI